jgi:hypothetical protein
MDLHARLTLSPRLTDEIDRHLDLCEWSRLPQFTLSLRLTIEIEAPYAFDHPTIWGAGGVNGWRQGCKTYIQFLNTFEETIGNRRG